jgi:hypothetical protein
MTSVQPTPKVQAVGLGGAAAIVIVFVAGQFGLEMSPEVAAAIAVLLSTGAGWIKGDSSSS